MTGAALWTPPAGSIPTLPVPSLDGIRSAHLVGIGGAGMRNLARVMAARGLAVQGSDLKDSPYVADLRARGIAVRVGHDADAMGDPDVVIVSSAIAEHNVELAAARDRGIPVWRRQQALAALAAGHRVVSVAGTHGKTTTTSMIAAVFEAAGADPTYLIGGDLNESGSGARHGAGDLFVFEADESDGSHLLVPPWVGIITSIEEDHLDFYPGGLAEIERSFARYAASAGTVVASADDARVRTAVAAGGGSALWYGEAADADLRLTVDALGPDGARGRLAVGGDEVDLRLRIDGPHNLANAAAAIGVASLAGIAPREAAGTLAGFGGVHRRFEFRGEARGVRFYDDYGHNPTEMAVTIATARRRAPARLVALVQPHRHARVQALWRELGASVAGADLVVVTEVYAAAQQPIPGVTGQLVADGVRAAAPEVPTVYLPHRADVVDHIAAAVRPGDLVVTMGCGDVWMIGDAILARLEDGTG
ncbi:MAG TPA: UDP-N-acetylmuramate--L-alanine ligase [Actinomycetota bacterium]|nr:UDP-N-acetylmuramate--L-alanine ligase [Actinomycetota bacterium]